MVETTMAELVLWPKRPVPISWPPVLVVEEAGVPRENHRVHPFCNLQSWARTQAILVIGLYELLGNTTL